MFLQTLPHAYSLVKSGGSPDLEILYDIYHVQIQEGNSYQPAIMHGSIGYLQMGDTQVERNLHR